MQDLIQLLQATCESLVPLAMSSFFSPRPFFVLLKIIVTISMIKQYMFIGNPGNTGHGGGKDDGETGASFLIFALFTFS